MLYRIIKHLRNYHALSTTNMAKNLNVPISQVSEMENQTRPVTLTTLEKYAEFLRFPTPTWIMLLNDLDDGVLDIDTSAFPERLQQYSNWLKAHKNDELANAEAKLAIATLE